MQNKVKGIKSYRVLKLYLFLGLFVFLTIGVMAQQASVNGVIKDSNGIVVPYASVEFYTQGETQELIDGTMSDEDGSFSVENLPFGDYELVVTAVGFSEFAQFIEINKSKLNLDKIVLKSDFVELAAVEIRGETSQYRTEIDKRVVDVGKDLVSAGSDAASVLNNIPSISVDQESGQISLRGNENVKVMVDGKPSNIPVAQLLKQLPSNAISKVEIITNPSAKYEPEGNSGILNIITHKDKRKGYHVGIDMGMTYGDNLRNNGSINANINTGSFNFFGNANANFGKNRFHGVVENYDTKLDQSFDVTNENNSQLYKVGFDWFIGDKSALTIYTSQFASTYDGVNQANVFDNLIQQFYENTGKSSGKYRNEDYSLNFKQDFGKDDHNLVLDAIYSKSKDDDKRWYNNSFPAIDAPHIYEEFRDTKHENTRVNLDYTNQIIDGGKIEAGLQFRQQKTDSEMLSSQVLHTPDLETFSPDVTYDFTRNIYSAYLNYGQKFGKIGMQLGVRAEQVEENSSYDITPTGTGKFKNDYVEFYPSAFFTYDISDRGQFSLNYSRRVDRPGIYQLTPVPEWSTATMQSIGNPDLKPQFTNSFELGYLQRFKGGSVSATAFYRKVNDVIFRYITEDENDPRILNQMYINYEDSESYGIELSANYRPTKWWNLNTSFDAYANQFYMGEDKTKGTPWSLRMNNNFNLLKNLSLQNFFMYRGEYKFIQGEMDPMWRMDLGARYSFMEGKATLTARVSDIFKTFHSKAIITSPNQGVGKFYWEAHTLYVGFSYNFGGDVRKRTLKQENNSSGTGGGIGF